MATSQKEAYAQVEVEIAAAIDRLDEALEALGISKQDRQKCGTVAIVSSAVGFLEYHKVPAETIDSMVIDALRIVSKTNKH